MGCQYRMKYLALGWLFIYGSDETLPAPMWTVENPVRYAKKMSLKKYCDPSKAVKTKQLNALNTEICTIVGEKFQSHL
jgi:hypothetical protein